jgi:hypothetical protein
MSFHIAVLITSEKCGHCRTMRGSGRLLSQTEIKKEGKHPSVPGGHHWDAKFMKKLITADSDSAKLRILNVHYKNFNPGEGVSDLSVFTLEPDNKTVRQTILKEKEGKTIAEIYTIGDTGKKVGSQDIPNDWTDTVKTYLPVNLSSYAYFYPTLSIFHFDAWMQSIKNNTPVFGYINGLESKTESPYGGIPGQNPNPSDFSTFLASFFNGSKKLLEKPVASPKSNDQNELSPPLENPAPILPQINTEQNSNESTPKNIVRVPTVGSCQGLNFRLYVKE